MAESQLAAITDLLRTSPLDMGGDPHTMRIVFDEMIGSHPVPEDVRTITVELGGVSAIAVGAMILTGVDRRVETAMISASPSWLTDLTTQF